MKRLIPLVITILLIGAFAIVGNRPRSDAAGPDATARAMQDPASLDRRISMLEQRFYFIESSMRRLEQQQSQQVSRLPNDQRTEMALLRNEVESLKGQLQALSCGLARLDERTLPPSLRQSRRDDSGSYKDPCRLNPETPLRLSTRP